MGADYNERNIPVEARMDDSPTEYLLNLEWLLDEWTVGRMNVKRISTQSSVIHMNILKLKKNM